jgi:hypothetical protein
MVMKNGDSIMPRCSSTIKVLFCGNVAIALLTQFLSLLVQICTWFLLSSCAYVFPSTIARPGNFALRRNNRKTDAKHASGDGPYKADGGRKLFFFIAIFINVGKKYKNIYGFFLKERAKTAVISIATIAPQCTHY